MDTQTRHGGHWLSSNPDKAWAELVFVAYTPLWMIAVALVMLTGWVKAWGDVGFMVFSCLVAAPAVVAPALLHSNFSDGRRWYQTYWFKLNVWAAILVFGGTYFGTHYFFDLMGMSYGFPVTWTFESPVVGRASGKVPLFMYPLTQAYFVSYFVGLTVLYRYLRTRLQLGWLGRIVAVVVLSYLIAFAETLAMANPLIDDYFRYADRTRMLLFGSFGYAIYFVIGLPMAFRIDEPTREEPQPCWSAAKVAFHAVAAYMLILCGLELWAQLIGPL
jgi:cycloeucalenol cycloisomerase